MSETWGGDAARRWFPSHTFAAAQLPTVEELAERKRAQGVRVSVGLPAMNEGETIGSILDAIRTDLMERSPLVDDLAVLDGGSTDDTQAIARKAGAEVYVTDEVLPQRPAIPGKGEALWRSLHSLRGDLIIWVDSDIRNFGSHFVSNLIAPLLVDPELAFVKGFYRRPLQAGEAILPDEGGRVTELLARPLLSALFPELTGFLQPLSGEYGGRREALLDLPFFTGYSVEIGLLIDLLSTVGLERMAQVDLSERIHRNRKLEELGPMAAAIARTILLRAVADGRLSAHTPFEDTPFLYPGTGPTLAERVVLDVECPPMRTLEES